MKKTLVYLIVVLLIICVIIVVKINDSKSQKQQILKFNSEYEFYAKESVLGTDITTIINKATDNNEKYNIEKDNKGKYIEDEENSIKIYIKMKFTDNTYPMENFYKAGINDFTKYFGNISFKNTKNTYHKNGKISSMTFEEI